MRDEINTDSTCAGTDLSQCRGVGQLDPTFHQTKQLRKFTANINFNWHKGHAVMFKLLFNEQLIKVDFFCYGNKYLYLLLNHNLIKHDRKSQIF